LNLPAGHPLRVLHAPEVVGGHAPTLARAERAAGLRSVSVSLYGDRYGYGCDEVIWRPGSSRMCREAARWRLFSRALREFDVIHLNFGLSILSWGTLFTGRARLGLVDRLAVRMAPHLDLLDLPALSRRGKLIAITFQGDDARQGDYCLEHFEISVAREAAPGYYSPWSDRRKRERIVRFDRYADLVYALNPDLLHVLPERARFLPYCNVDLDEWHPVEQSQANGRRPVVVHAPSDRRAKGTAAVLAAVERLREAGVDFEFRLIEGMTRPEARRLYEDADLVIDQLLVGWYGGFAVEAMALGKPVIAYIRKEDLRLVDASLAAALPIIAAEPRDLASVLAEWVGPRRAELRQVGRASRAYVETWHDARKIAATLKQDYEHAWSAKHNPAQAVPA